MENKIIAKLTYPYNYYYKRIMEGACPLCDGVDQISISKNKDVIWCNGYEKGMYLTEEACDTYASDGDGSCKYCVAGGFAFRHYPTDLVMVCENCRQAINFETKTISKIL
jgi:hypothetical protein